MTKSFAFSLLSATLATGGCAGTQTLVAGDVDTRIAGDRAAAPASPVELELAFERAAESIAPSVVSITARQAVDEDVPAFLRPFADWRRAGVAAGTGDKIIAVLAQGTQQLSRRLEPFVRILAEHLEDHEVGRVCQEWIARLRLGRILVDLLEQDCVGVLAVKRQLPRRQVVKQHP